MVPLSGNRTSWRSGSRQSDVPQDCAETKKALSFADSYMAVSALIALVYDWAESGEDGVWALTWISE